MKANLLYINLDGFGRYYYDAMPDKETQLPNITSLIKDGVFFDNATTGVPSITFPMQSAIVSGCYSSGTKNCDKYWHREQNAIVPLKRHNEAQTIGEVLRGQGVSFVAIQQFALQDKGCEYGNKDYLYVQPGGDYLTRFALLLELLEHNTITAQQGKYTYAQLPQAMFLYIDDLDTIGHNPPKLHALTDRQRIANVQKRLVQIDAQLGLVINALKARGIYDSTYILLTTDHGMISYRGASGISALKKILLENGYTKIISHTVGPLPTKDFDILLTAHDLQCQLYFNTVPKDEIRLKERLLTLPCVEKVLTGDELRELGVMAEYADMVISPAPGHHFSTEHSFIPQLCATHDSLNEKCQHIFAVMTGPFLRKAYCETAQTFNIDYLPTLCRALDIPVMKNATGNYLDTIWQ